MRVFCDADDCGNNEDGECMCDDELFITNNTLTAAGFIPICGCYFEKECDDREVAWECLN